MLKIFNILIPFSVLACGKTKDVAQFNSKENSRYIEMFHEGIRYKQKKQFHNAIHVFEACTELNQFDDAPYFLLSEVYLQTGQRERSIEALQKAIKLDNKNQWYKQELALKYHEIGNYEQAILAYKNLLKSNPENPDWLISLSECYFKSNQMSESYQTMEKLEQVIGSNPEIIIEKYRNLFFQKKYNQGEKILLEGLNMFPDSPDLLAILERMKTL